MESTYCLKLCFKRLKWCQDYTSYHSVLIGRRKCIWQCVPQVIIWEALDVFLSAGLLENTRQQIRAFGLVLKTDLERPFQKEQIHLSLLTERDALLSDAVDDQWCCLTGSEAIRTALDHGAQKHPLLSNFKLHHPLNLSTAGFFIINGWEKERFCSAKETQGGLF